MKALQQFSEHYNFKPIRIEEHIDDKTGKKKVIATGEYQLVEVENRNKRIYPESLWKWVFESNHFKNLMDRKLMFGYIGHPKVLDGESPDFSKASHITTKFWREGEQLFGESECVEGITKEGDILAGFLKLGCLPGWSSRGEGSIKETRENGSQVLDDEFYLNGFDVVIDESTPGAIVHIKEQIERKEKEGDKVMAEEKLVEQVFDITKNLSKQIEEVKQSLTTKIEKEKELYTDNSVMSSKLENLNQDNIALSKEIKKLEEESISYKDLEQKYEALKKRYDVATNLLNETIEQAKQIKNNKSAEINEIRIRSAAAENLLEATMLRLKQLSIRYYIERNLLPKITENTKDIKELLFKSKSIEEAIETFNKLSKITGSSSNVISISKPASSKEIKTEEIKREAIIKDKFFETEEGKLLKAVMGK